MTDSAPDTHGLQDHERSTVTAAGCPSGIRCCEEGWLTCTEPPGHDPDFHRAPGHEWDDAMAREFAELEELDA